MFRHSPAYRVRMALSVVVVITATELYQFCHASPVLPRVWTRFSMATAFVTGGSLLIYVTHALVGFPPPFTLHFVSLLWGVLMAAESGSGWMWRAIIHASTGGVRHNFAHCAWIVASNAAMVAVDLVVIHAFDTFDGIRQSLFVMSFPVLSNIMLKTVTSFGIHRLEDLAPVSVVLNVAVFHALLLSCAMQSSVSRGALMVTMGVDVFQLAHTVARVLEYATLELLSLATLATVLDRMLRFSTMWLLVFALSKHALLAQSFLCI